MLKLMPVVGASPLPRDIAMTPEEVGNFLLFGPKESLVGMAEDKITVWHPDPRPKRQTFPKIVRNLRNK